MTTPPEPPYGEQPPPAYGTPPEYGTPEYGSSDSGIPVYPNPDEPGFAGLASIPAPPGQWVGPPLAPFELRLVSGLIDSAIVSVPYWILLKLGSVLLALAVFLGLWLYLQHMQGTTAQTPGKRIVRTKLLREADGVPIGFGAAVRRSLLHIVDALPCFVGFLYPIWDDKKQTFADKISGTVVIRG